MLDLITMFHRHRDKAISCCSADCFCWEVEKYINEIESIQKEEAYHNESDWLNDYLNR